MPGVAGPSLRRLHPEPGEVPLAELYAGLTLPAGTASQDAWVALCLVTSLDGAVSVEGSSRGLGGAADLLALSRLRGSNDVSLVGAGTVRTEAYAPLRGSEARRADRVSRGLTPSPRLAIVTATAALDPGLEVFADPRERPLVLVSSAADPASLDRLGEVADLHLVDEVQIRGSTIIAALVGLGYRRIVGEGGPRLNQTLLEEDLIDEAFLTLAPSVVGGPADRIVTGSRELRRDFELRSVFEHENDLLLRYRHVRHGDPATPGPG